MERTNKRNAWLDLIKLFASFMVVFIHIKFPGIVGRMIDALARFAVPLFFAVSGFFAFGATTKAIKRRLIKIVELYLIASLVYHFYYIVLALKAEGGTGFLQYITGRFNFGGLKLFLILNIPFSSEHLWFLLALAYVYVIWIVAMKISVNDTCVFIISTLCLVAHLVLGEGLSIFGVKISSEYVRNFALMGVPFFGFGYLIAKNKEKIANIKNYILILMIVFGVVELCLSNYYFGKNELYIGAICCCFVLLAIAIKNADRSVNSFWQYLSSANTDIYVYHILISEAGLLFLGIIGVRYWEGVFTYIWTVAVCLLSLLFSLVKTFVFSKIAEAMKKRKAEKLSAQEDTK